MSHCEAGIETKVSSTGKRIGVFAVVLTSSPLTKFDFRAILIVRNVLSSCNKKDLNVNIHLREYEYGRNKLAS